MPETIPGNGLQSTLAAAMTTTSTGLQIQAADAAAFPPAAAPNPSYRCLLYADPVNGPWEIVTVTAGHGTQNLTVIRASEPFRGTQSPQAWAIGTTVVPVLTQGNLNNALVPQVMRSLGSLIAGGGTYNPVPVSQSKPVTVVDTFSGAGSNITDGNTQSTWWSSTHPPNAWFYIDLGTPMLITAARLNQYGGTDCHRSTQFHMAFSNDAINWTQCYPAVGEAQTPNGGDTGIFILTSPGSARYWRFYGTGADQNCGWNVNEAMLYQGVAAGTPVELAPVSDGNILTLDSAQPQGMRWAPPTPGSQVLLNYEANTVISNGATFAVGVWSNLGPQQTINVTDPNATIEIDVSGFGSCRSNAAAGTDVGVALLIDGITRKRIGGVSTEGSSGNWDNLLGGVGPLLMQGLTSGSHTIQLQVYPATQAITLYMDATGVVQSLNIRVLQVPSTQTIIPTNYGFEVVLAQSQASVTLPISGSLPQSFRDIEVTWQARGDNASNATNLRLRLNGDSGANYNWQQVYASGTGLSTTEHLADTSFGVGDVACTNAPANATGAGRISLPNYSGTTFRKDVVALDGVNQNDTASNILTEHVYGEWKSTAAVTSITLFPTAGNFLAGSKFTLTLGGPPLSPPGPAAPPALPGTKVLLNQNITYSYNGGTVTGAVWSSVPNCINIPFTVDDPNAIIEISIGGVVTLGNSGTNNTDCESQLLVDSTAYFLSQETATPSGFCNPLGGSTPVLITGLSAGQHLLTLQVQPIQRNVVAWVTDVWFRVKQIPQQLTSYGGVASKKVLDWAAASDIASNVALAASTWTDFPGTNATFFVDDANAEVVIEPYGNLRVGSTAAAGNIASRVIVDGTSYPFGGTAEAANIFGNALSGSQPVVLTGLGVGAHALKVQVYMDTGSAAMYCRAAAWPATEFFGYRVMQISQGVQPPPPQYGFEVVLAQPQASVTLPISGSLPQGFRDARLIVRGASAAATTDDNLQLQFNGDTAANYEGQELYAAAASLAGTRRTAQSNIIGGTLPGTTYPAGSTAQTEVRIAGYTDNFRKTTFSTEAIDNGNGTAFLMNHSGIWHNTAPITTITATLASGGNFAVGTRFTLVLEGPPVSPPGIPGPGASPIKGPEAVLSVAAPSVTLPVSGQLLQNYRNIRVKAQARGDAAATQIEIDVRFNGDTGANYDWHENYWNTGASSAADSYGQTVGRAGYVAAANAPANYADHWQMDIFNYAGSVFYKELQANSGEFRAQSTGNWYGRDNTCVWRSTAPITSITILAGAGNFVAGSTFTLYYEP